MTARGPASRHRFVDEWDAIEAVAEIVRRSPVEGEIEDSRTREIEVQR